MPAGMGHVPIILAVIILAVAIYVIRRRRETRRTAMTNDTNNLG
jgi:preprotein translocase subunit YajC